MIITETLLNYYQDKKDYADKKNNNEFFERRKALFPCLKQHEKSMKIKIFILLCLLVLALPNTFVQAKEDSLIGVSTLYEEKRGAIVDLGVFIQSNENIAGGSLKLVYDKTKLDVRKVELGDQLTNYLTSYNFSEPGTIALEWAKAAGKNLDGTLLIINARLLNASETIDLRLKDVQLYNDDLSEVDVQTLDGQIKPFKGTKKAHDVKVNGNKEWTIELNKDFNPATINRHTIFVKDYRGNLIDVNIQKINQHSFKIKPKANYLRGNYTLDISEQVRSISGSKLEPCRFEFSVE